MTARNPKGDKATKATTTPESVETPIDNKSAERMAEIRSVNLTKIRDKAKSRLAAVAANMESQMATMRTKINSEDFDGLDNDIFFLKEGL